MHEYQARCVEVVDGDTQDVIVDLGFHIQRRIRLRLQGVDTHETYGVSHDSEAYRRGKRETEFVEEWLEAAAADVDSEWPLVQELEISTPGRAREQLRWSFLSLVTIE